MGSDRQYTTFADFYPFYLGEHANRSSRRLHFLGANLAILLLLAALLSRHWWLLPLAPVQGYLFAWAGHFFFELNRPATFRYPLFSFLGDWCLWWGILTGRIGL
jgi:hypothetical protein